jgi:hypothetical protein
MIDTLGLTLGVHVSLGVTVAGALLVGGRDVASTVSLTVGVGVNMRGINVGELLAL